MVKKEAASQTRDEPIRLEIFKHLFAAIAEEMGVVLRKASYSPNIKERRDFSCAVFDAQGRIVAQAAHIPVHLGSMPLSVQAALQAYPLLEPGDTLILNDPYRGGTHLPDVTLVSPVFLNETCSSQSAYAFVASRAHHADIGGMTAGSMPVAREIFQEGLIIPPLKLMRRGELQQEMLNLILANVRTPQERLGDLYAQIAANQRGVERLQALVRRYGEAEISWAMEALYDYTARMTRHLLARIPPGEYSFADYMDDDGIEANPVLIRATLRIQGDQATVDFTGSAPQQKGSINAVFAITLSAVHYVFRCLLGLDVPNNAGCLEPIEVIAPAGTVVNALPPAAVAAGNVETSQRIVDVLLGALAAADAQSGGALGIPAASQGTMNNLSLGGYDPQHKQPFTYYETIGGGMGARHNAPGPSALHSHMTNTLNTPIEALEFSYPLRVLCYEIRRNSGGKGRFNGGDGIRRDIQVLLDCQATILSERRRFAPYGLQGGEDGKNGENLLLRAGETMPLPGKCTVELKAGDVLSIRTPGGGGYGKPQ